MTKELLYVKELEYIGTQCLAELRHPGKEAPFPLHWHDHLELEILLSGTGIHTYNGQTSRVTAGDCWLMSFYDFHQFTPTEGTTLFHISFDHSFLPPELIGPVAGNGFCCHIDADGRPEAEELCRLLVAEQTSNKPFAVTAQKALLSRLLVLLLRRAALPAPAHSPAMAAALSYVHAHFKEDISLEEVAKAQNLSVNYFGQLFKNALGVPFRDYLNKLRLKYACDLLATSPLSIKEIAFAAGFSSVEYFFYSFKKQLSLTPAAYRKNTKGSA